MTIRAASPNWVVSGNVPGTLMVTKTKLSGQTQMWPAYLLGRNEYGTWLYAPSATPLNTPTGEQLGTLQTTGAQLIPTGGWWVAWWWEDGSITIDITTPAKVAADSVGYADLGVGLWAAPDGGRGVADQDEYESARAFGLITDSQDAHVRAAVTTLEQQLSQRVEPFGQVGWRWFHGVSRSELHVVPYDSSWPDKFANARDEMMPFLPPGSRVEHFGSTSVPGMAAKDCLDIAVVVPRQDQFDQVVDRLESIGYEARPNAFGDDPGHVFIRRVTNGRRTHHVHLYCDGHPNLTGVLAFRDLLRADPTARQRYQAVKLALAEAAPYDRSGYAAGKNEVAQDLLRLALARQELQPKSPRG